MDKIDLSKPAFGAGAQVIEPEESQASESQPKDENESQVVEPVKSSDEEDDQKVPYSRFKKFHDLASEREHENELLKVELETLRSVHREPIDDKLPEWWVKLYGDSDASKEAWGIQSEQNEQFRSQVKEEAISSIREEQQKEAVRVSENINTIDQSIDALETDLGRTLTEKEQTGLLDIVDDYTPKDEDGNYLGAPIAFDKAWEILQLKSKVAIEPTQKAKANVASIISSQNSGEPTAEQVEQNKNFNPLDWGAYKKRI
jgi:hypothetical protein